MVPIAFQHEADDQAGQRTMELVRLTTEPAARAAAGIVSSLGASDPPRLLGEGTMLLWLGTTPAWFARSKT